MDAFQDLSTLLSHLQSSGNAADNRDYGFGSGYKRVERPGHLPGSARQLHRIPREESFEGIGDYLFNVMLKPSEAHSLIDSLLPEIK